MLVCASASCSRAPAEAASVSAVSTAAEPPPGMPHGDHNPHHGGTVWMYKEVHFEVVLSPEGRHRVYFSDAVREDLPAATVSRLTLTIERPGAPAEILQGRIDEHGESWETHGRAVAGTDASARVAFEMSGEPYWIDMPFIPQAR